MSKLHASLGVGSLLLLAAAMPALSQVTGGTILGTIKDPSGAGIADAKITITEVNRNFDRVSHRSKWGLCRALLDSGYLPGRCRERGISAWSFSRDSLASRPEGAYGYDPSGRAGESDAGSGGDCSAGAF